MTMDSEQVAKLLAEVGERMAQIQNVVRDEEHPRWAIELEDGSIVLASLDTERRKLRLIADLGRPHEEHRLAVCEALLMFTSIRHMDDIAMALSEPQGGFRLCAHLSEWDLDVFKLETAVHAFAVSAQQWRAIIERGAQ